MMRLRNSRAMAALRLRLTAVTCTAERGSTTAEYAIVTLAACGFAALLVAIIKSDAVRDMLLSIVRSALSLAG